jgi:hypothetical protein
LIDAYVSTALFLTAVVYHFIHNQRNTVKRL